MPGYNEKQKYFEEEQGGGTKTPQRKLPKDLHKKIVDTPPNPLDSYAKDLDSYGEPDSVRKIFE